MKTGETLESISQKLGIDSNILRVFHNAKCDLKDLIGSELTKSMKVLILPADLESIAIKNIPKEEEINKNKLEFDKIARYQSEQFNVTRVNNEVITLSSEIKSRYIYSLPKNNSEYMNFVLEDYVFSVEPDYLKDGFQLSELIENIKKRIVISQDNKGLVKEVLNLKELRSKWNEFVTGELPNIPLYKNLKEQMPEQAKDIINTGNLEFSSSDKLGLTLDKNLFFHIFLRANLGEELENYKINQYSQLFPNLELNANVSKTKVKEENGIITYRLVGTLDRNNLLEEDLKRRYDEIYKPMIKYNYTEFDYIYRITYSIENDTNLLLEAKASLCEKIKNNFEVITEFNIKKIEL